ncbi:MAG: hypothetical protein NC299_08730 [Lachnospiraceae bacterium]|nr:hypothetical protein [Lachnospiraceae bacterium]
MKLEKILTALIACACALTAVTVSAFASSDDASDAGTSADGSVEDSSAADDDGDLVDDEKPAYVYTWSVPAAESEDSGWVSENVAKADLIGSLDPADIDVMVIKGAAADDEIGAGFNTTLSGTKADGYYQTNDDDENWPSNSVTIKGSAVDWENYYFQLFSNRGEATTVTVSVYTSADNNDSTPSDSTPSNSDSDSASSDSDSGGGLISDSNVSNSGSGAQNPGTGIAMTFVPAVIAGAVVIASKKRR